MPPNILAVMADDLAWGDLGVNGNPVIDTPHLDALAAAGARLTRYCSGPLCTPARASFMTGRYHQRTAAVDTYCGRSMMRADEVTLAHVLERAGYRTGCFGKWHLGDSYPTRAMDFGFQETLTHKTGGIGWPGDHPDNYARRGESYFDPVVFRNGTPERVEGYCTDIFTQATLDFVEAGEGPFFAYLATNAPHTPLQTPDHLIDKYVNRGINDTHARLYAMVEGIDLAVGRLLARLEDLGRADDTIVIFTSDHGPCPSARWFFGPADQQVRWNDGLRGEKGSLYEGGIRVPCLWRWPNHIPPGTQVGGVTSPIDVLPTLADLTGAPLPKTPHVDGLSLATALTTGATDSTPAAEAAAAAAEPLAGTAPGGGTTPGSTVEGRRLFMQWHRGDVGERYRNYAVITDRYKLHRPGQSLTTPVDSVPDELYDLTTDPAETTNLAADRPEVAAELRAAYDAWFDDVSQDAPPSRPWPRIVAGAPAESPTVLSRQDWRLDTDLSAFGEMAGFGAAAEARWELDGEGGTFDVTIRFDPAPPEALRLYAQVHLLIGTDHQSRPWAWNVGTYTLRNVTLPSGPVDLRAWAGDESPQPVIDQITSGNFQPGARREAALYVDLTRTT